MNYALRGSPPGVEDDPLELPSFSGLGNSVTTLRDENQQAQIEGHERLLELKRQSIWDIGCLCHAKLTLMLGSLQYSDDEKTWEYCRDTVGNFRAIARLVNDLRDTSRCAP